MWFLTDKNKNDVHMLKTCAVGARGHNFRKQANFLIDFGTFALKTLLLYYACICYHVVRERLVCALASMMSFVMVRKL